MTSLSDTLRAYMQDKGVGTRKLSAMARVSRSRIQAILNGKCDPGPSELERLVWALDTTTKEPQ